MNLKPSVVPELSHLLISDRFYNVFVVDRTLYGQVHEVERGIYVISNDEGQAVFTGNAEQISEYLWLGVSHV